MHHVLDASAVIAYMRGENGGEAVLSVLLNPENTCFAHALNLRAPWQDSAYLRGVEIAGMRGKNC